MLLNGDQLQKMKTLLGWCFSMCLMCELFPWCVRLACGHKKDSSSKLMIILTSQEGEVAAKFLISIFSWIR